MAGYLFFPPANDQLDKIWEYTEETHGEQQAEKYILNLHSHLQKLSEKKLLWKTLPRKWVVPADLDTDVYFSKYKYHVIFFRKFPSGKIGVMSIIHEVMDIPVRLKEDLSQISKRHV